MEEFLTVSADISDLQSSNSIDVHTIPSSQITPPSDVFYVANSMIHSNQPSSSHYQSSMDMRNIDFIGKYLLVFI